MSGCYISVLTTEQPINMMIRLLSVTGESKANEQMCLKSTSWGSAWKYEKDSWNIIEITSLTEFCCDWTRNFHLELLLLFTEIIIVRYVKLQKIN